MSEVFSSDPVEASDLPSDVAQPERSSRIIAVTSGKGGVGKTNVTTNLGIALAMLGAKVCVFDADTSLANINILLGIAPSFTLENFLNGEKSLDEIAVEGPRGVTIIPAASGIAEHAHLTPEQRERLFGALEELERRYDYVLIDTAAGVGDTVMSFVQSAQYAVVVISPEPTSLTDAFALVKTLKQRQYEHPIYVLVNMVSNFHNSMDIFKRFQSAVQKYLKTTVRYLGYITLDENVISSVHLQRPVVLAEPDSSASRCFHTLAEAIRKNFRFSGESHSLSGYWRQYAGRSEGPTPPPEIEQAGEPSPEEMAPTAAAGSGSLEDIAREMQRLIGTEESDEEAAAAALKPLLETFAERFGHLPYDVRQSTYRALELGGFPEQEIRDLICTLESLYQTRFQRPVHDLEDSVIRLLADVHGSEDKIQDVRQHLETSFARQFGKKLFDPEATLAEEIAQGAYDTERFGQLLHLLNDSYRQHHGKPYEDDKDRLIRDLRAIALRMEEQESSLRNGLTRLSEWFNDTVSAREELIGRIDHPTDQGDDEEDTEGPADI